MFAAKNVKQQLFMKNFHYIFFLGAFGTLITFVCMFSFITAAAHMLRLFPEMKDEEGKERSN